MSLEFVEVFGIPASGKTMLVNRMDGNGLMSRESGLRNALTIRRLGVIRWFLNMCSLPGGSFDEVTAGLLEGGALVDRKVFQCVFNYLTEASPMDREAVVALRGIFRTAREYELLKAQYANGKVLMDEGWVHRGLTVFGMRLSDEVPEEGLTRYVDSIPLPQYAVYVTCDADTALARIRSRHLKARPWWDSWTQEEQKTALVQAARCADRIAEHLERRGCRVFRSDGTVPAELMKLLKG
ncbi:MAG: hypothetical protein AB7T27_04365 [Kiritimatiellia bacterium]